MTSKAELRSSVRTGARRLMIAGRTVLDSATPTRRQRRRAPGRQVLLFHNTPPAAVARLARYVDRHPRRFASFDPVGPAAEGAELQLSFDDGFRSNLEAGRMLADRGIAGVFYVPTDVIGMDKVDSDRLFRRTQDEGVMGWDDLQQLRDWGHRVGSHCRQHLPMVGFSDAEAEDQLKGSVEVLRQRLGDTQDFAWPFGGLHHAPVDLVVQWSRDVDVLAASGVRGVNTPEKFARDGFIRRDAVDLRWLELDVTYFSARARAL